MTQGENQATPDRGAGIEIVAHPKAELDLATSEGVVERGYASEIARPVRSAARPDRPILLRRPRAQRLSSGSPTTPTRQAAAVSA